MEFVPPLSQHNISDLILYMNNWEDNMISVEDQTWKRTQSH